MNVLATASAIDGRNAHAFQVGGRSGSDRLFRAALRHSRLVRFLRWAIPAGAVVALVALVFFTWFNPMRMLAKLPVDVGNVVVSGTKITMEQPRISGYTSDARAYQMTARSAAQDLKKPDQVELKDVRAKVELQDQGLMELSAATGLYDSKNELLKLNQDILLTTSTGYEGRLIEADVDVRKGKVVSEKPVVVKMLDGAVLNANRMEVINSGEVVTFSGGVVMVLHNTGGAARDQAATP